MQIRLPKILFMMIMQPIPDIVKGIPTPKNHTGILIVLDRKKILPNERYSFLPISHIKPFYNFHLFLCFKMLYMLHLLSIMMKSTVHTSIIYLSLFKVEWCLPAINSCEKRFGLFAPTKGNPFKENGCIQCARRFFLKKAGKMGRKEIIIHFFKNL